MVRRISLAGTFFLLVGCAAGHGGRSDPIASADFPFEPSLAGELSSTSRKFAVENGLQFQDNNQAAARLLTLSADNLRIEVTIADNRLKVVGLGDVTPLSIRVVARYIEEAQEVH